MAKQLPGQNEAIITAKLSNVQEAFAQVDHFNHYILETLNNFAYRYFDGADEARATAPNELHVMAIEKGIKEAIKIKNETLRKGIGDLVKKVSREEGPTIARELRVQILNRDPGKGGVAKIFSRISWGHPEHSFTAGTFVEKTSTLKFEDDIFFRNHLAKNLEEVCELFES